MPDKPKRKLRKLPAHRQMFRDTLYGVDLIFEVHRPPYLDNNGYILFNKFDRYNMNREFICNYVPPSLVDVKKQYDMGIKPEPDPFFWFKNHPDSANSFRKWFVFKNKGDFEKFFMAHQGYVPELKHWHDGHELEWVLADDGGVCEVVKRGSFGRHAYIRTIVGTFVANPKKRDIMPYFMDTDFNLHPNRSSISGVKYYNFEYFLKNKRYITDPERIFAANIAHSVDLMFAYKQCYPCDKTETKIQERNALALLSAERIKKEVSKNLEEIFEQKGVNHEYVINEVKRLSKLMEENGDLRGAMDGVKTLAKGIATFETASSKQLQGGMMTMIKGFQSFSLDGDVESIEDAMEVEQIEAPKKTNDETSS